MRAEDNALDLNNFPGDFCSKDGKQVVHGSSSSDGGGYRKKKGSGGKEGKEERGKVYECRFCSLKFCKSQALGGHMNRHRQERETETLNQARLLVFGNDALPPLPPHHHHLGGAYHPGSHMSDPILAFRSPSSSLYTPPGRLFSGSSSASSSSAFLQPYLYPSSPHQPAPYPSSSSQFSTSHDFSLGSQGLNRPNQYTGLHGTTQRVGSSDSSTNYTCIGAPVGEVSGGQYQKEGLTWGRRMEPGHNQNHHHGHRNSSSAINRFQDDCKIFVDRGEGKRSSKSRLEGFPNPPDTTILTHTDKNKNKKEKGTRT